MGKVIYVGFSREEKAIRELAKDRSKEWKEERREANLNKLLKQAKGR